MAKEDLKLRVTSNAPLTTKGSPLTWVESDANWIAIYNAFVELSQSSYVDSYDGGITYDDTVNNYVMYANQLWNCISDTPIVGVTPVECVKWTAVYATSIARHIKEYRASLTQTDAAPTATGEVSSIGSVTYGNTDVGVYTINKGGFFDNASVIFSAVKGFIEVESITSDTITFKTYNISGDLSNKILLNTGIIITLP